MKRREMIRASLLAGAAAALRPSTTKADTAPPATELTPAQQGVDASKDLLGANWKPLFLDEHQNETLIVLSDLMIPATDTPGAKDALVNRYIDLVLAAQTQEAQRSFLNSLNYLDGESIRTYNAAFRYLPREQQDEILHSIAYPKQGSHWTRETAAPPDPGHMHFENLKQHIVMAYYNSQTGEKDLGWDGAVAHGDYEGCSHSENKHA